ncbi:hypothetical protein PFISCL1PPCAC_21928, partial [Pristionchus fissidentatus]
MYSDEHSFQIAENLATSAAVFLFPFLPFIALIDYTAFIFAACFVNVGLTYSTMYVIVDICLEEILSPRFMVLSCSGNFLVLIGAASFRIAYSTSPEFDAEMVAAAMAFVTIICLKVQYTLSQYRPKTHLMPAYAVALHTVCKLSQDIALFSIPFLPVVAMLHAQTFCYLCTFVTLNEVYYLIPRKSERCTSEQCPVLTYSLFYLPTILMMTFAAVCIAIYQSDDHDILAFRSSFMCGVLTLICIIITLRRQEESNEQLFSLMKMQVQQLQQQP